MSRFGNDDYDPQFPNQAEFWWANAKRAREGRRGQKALRELREILLALPEKKLIRGRLADENGHVCVVGAYALAKRVEKGEPREHVLKSLAAVYDPEDYDCDDPAILTADTGVAAGLTFPLAWELGDLNDESFYNRTPEERYEAILGWIEQRLVTAA